MTDRHINDVNCGSWLISAHYIHIISVLLCKFRTVDHFANVAILYNFSIRLYKWTIPIKKDLVLVVNWDAIGSLYTTLVPSNRQHQKWQELTSVIWNTLVRRTKTPKITCSLKINLSIKKNKRTRSASTRISPPPLHMHLNFHESRSRHRSLKYIDETVTKVYRAA